jgi:hypothetical protein
MNQIRGAVLKVDDGRLLIALFSDGLSAIRSQIGH